MAWARVVDLEGSGPRDPGAAMAVSGEGEVIGSVSGGCVEGAVVTEALDVLATGDRRLVTFGYSDDDAFAVGLTCGGTVHLFIEPFTGGPRAGGGDPRPPPRRARHRRRRHRRRRLAAPHRRRRRRRAGWPTPTCSGSCSATPRRRWPPAPPRSGATATAARPTRTPSPCSSRRSRRRRGCSCSAPSTSPPRSSAWPRCSASTSRCATPARCSPPRPGSRWPTRWWSTGRTATSPRWAASLGPRDAVCVLTHDAKFDVPAIVAALGTKVGYLGAMGSRRTTEQRAERLRDEGVTDEQLERLLAPIGLDLGARTPGGDGGGHLRRDHRPPHRPLRPPPAGRRRPHPLSLRPPGTGR